MLGEVITAEHVELVRAFVNTLDREDGVDVLDRGWLVDRGLLERGADVAPAGLERLREVREAIRTLLWANNGVPVDRARAAATLDAGAVATGLAVRFPPDGGVALEPTGDVADQATGRILGAVAALAGTESWSRLKACRLEACGWAFYDSARNRSRAWCSMAVCGNRAKARSYRARRGTAG